VTVRRGPPRARRNVFGDIAFTLSNLAQVAAAAAQTAPPVGVAIHPGGYGYGTGQAPVTVPANPVWLTLAQVLNEVPAGFQMTATPLSEDQKSFLRVVEHLSKIVNALSLAPNDPALLAEYKEVGEFLSTHPGSEALQAFLTSHPSLVTVAAASPAAAATGGYGVGYAGADDDWRALYDASTRTAQQLSTLTIGHPAPHPYGAGQRTEIVGPSIHRDRASGGLPDPHGVGAEGTGWGPGPSPYDLYYPPTYVQGPDGNLWPAPVGA